METRVRPRGTEHPEDGATGFAPAVHRADLFLYVPVLLLAAVLFEVQATSKTYIAELQPHLDLVRRIAEDGAWSTVPHPGFHWMVLGLSLVTGLGLGPVAVGLLSVFAVVISWMLLSVLRARLGGLYSDGQLAAAGAGLMLASAIWLPWFSHAFYLGQGTPNFWAVPTLVVVKPFALLSVLLFLYRERPSARPPSLRSAVLLSGVLLVGAVLKPNFALAFFPSAGLFMLVRQAGLRRILGFAVISIPTLALLLAQHAVWYGGRSGDIQLTFFGVWRQYTPSVPVSLLLATAFPLALLLTRFRLAVRDDRLLFCWIFTLVSFLQFAFLAEKRFFGAGNFSWAWNIALWFLFLFSAADFLRRLKEEAFDRAGQRIWRATVGSLFVLHVVSGVAYLVRQLLGLGYF